MFADDTTIFFQHKCLSELTSIANTQLENVNKCLIANKLSLNINKTNYIIFQPPLCKQSTKQLNIILNNHALQRVRDTEFLGVVIHEHLSWKPHIEYLLKKIRSSIYCIKKIKTFLDRKDVGKRQTVSYVMKDNNLLTIRQIRNLERATFVYINL